MGLTLDLNLGLLLLRIELGLESGHCHVVALQRRASMGWVDCDNGRLLLNVCLGSQPVQTKKAPGYQ